MTRFLLALAFALVACGALQAQPPQDMLAGRVAALEAKVAALEARLAVQTPAPPYAQPVSYGPMFGGDCSTGNCAGGSCGPAQGGYRFAPFGGMFRRR